MVGTHGLAAYAGRELEFAPTRTIDFGTLGMRAMQMSLYLIDSGVELKEGDTIGPEKFRVAHADAGALEEAPAYRLAAA